MAKLSIEEIIAAIKELTVLELNDLVKKSEEEFGVSAAAGLVMAAGAGGGAAEEVEEKTEFDVELTEIGGEKRVELQFEYLPSAKEVFDILVPQYVKGVIYGAMVEAYASEQNARMTAMDEASKNAEDMLDVLRINYNRARQAGITQEMTEISSGAAALADR